jgi:CheY-like chemotaxis protein/uncharacterized protein YegP (UPF0339 family)
MTLGGGHKPPLGRRRTPGEFSDWLGNLQVQSSASDEEAWAKDRAAVAQIRRMAASPMPSRSPASKRILIVEDELIIAQDLCAVLEELGYTVVGTAASAEEALQMAGEQHPDLVLMDIRLPGPTDGIQTANALRNQYHLPVVFLTANTDAQTLDRALEAEPSGYLAKPYNARTLVATIELAFRRQASDLSALHAHEKERALLEQQNAELGQLVQRLRLESPIDPATELPGRQHLTPTLKGEPSRAERAGQSVASATHPRFKILVQAPGELSFNLTAPTGTIILLGPAFPTVAALGAAIRSVKIKGRLHKNYDCRSEQSGNHHFVLKDSDGETLGTSPNYDSRAALNRGLEAVMAHAFDAPTVE